MRIGNSNTYELTIIDQDGPPELILAILPSTVSEGGTVTVTANLAPASGREVMVAVCTEDDTATTGEDYVGVDARWLVIPPGSTTAENPVFVATINDGREVMTETFSVRLGNERDAVLGDPQVLEVMIQNGDDPILEPDSDFLVARADAILQTCRA